MRTYATLRIDSNDGPIDAILAALPLEPTRVFIEGRPSRPGGSLLARKNEVQFSTGGKVDSIAIEDHLDLIRTWLVEHGARLRALKSIGCKLYVSVYVSFGEPEMMEFWFEPELMKILVDLGIHFWMDFYP